MADSSNLKQESPQETFRSALIDQLRKELIGPSEPAEVLDESPRQRYSAGVLFPSQITNLEIEDDGVSAGNNKSNLGEATENTAVQEIDIAETNRKPGREEMLVGNDDTITMANTYMPAAMGISFICDDVSSGLFITPRAAVYTSEKRKEETREFVVWKRTELKLSPVRVSLSLDSQQDIKIQKSSPHESLQIRGIVRRRKDGTRLVTVSIYNTKQSQDGPMVSPADCYFQVGFSVEADGQAPVFCPYQELTSSSDDKEEQGLRLLFRNRLSFGLGHGCAVNWGQVSGNRAGLVETDSLPTLKIPPVEPRQRGGDELSMQVLAGGADGTETGRIPDVLKALVEDYEEWIRLQTSEAVLLDPAFAAAAERHLAKCNEACIRIRRGINLLESSEEALRAFSLANRAILMQQYHSRRKTRSVGDEWEDLTADYTPSKSWMGKWRTFQIAFILMNLPSVTPDLEGEYPEDRDLVDLIWFPTGGGKTEAYLGLAAYTIFLRRLLNPSDSGCTVLMRYTLRLLTAQQFQRASALICACETIRQSSPEELGEDRITIGLWVGQSLTPNTRKEATYTLNSLVSKPRETENKFQLLKCPFCGTRLNEHGRLGYRATGRTPKKVLFVCPDSRCVYSTMKNPIPVLVTDDDIYNEPPTLLIGTVDKFAMLAWREQSGRIFGAGMSVSPPNLIIQDELHLISGPLGTVVGLYEGVIDLLCARNGIKPKIVGSTATIRRAEEQCKGLYNRPTFQFPPPGLDISDSYFATENPDASGRLYTGVFASAASSFVTANVRTSASLLQGCYALDLPEGSPESLRDPYWTLVQYFNSLRELGQALTLLQADIPEHILTIRNRTKGERRDYRWLNSIEELTSRKTAQEIPEILEDLEVSYPQEKGAGKRPVDALLATNMISVGVDVDRLGLMSIIGQPKTTSEYIQASSRVGRSKNSPGLVVTMYNPGKPRDRSHFEQFRAYHASLYRYVEPTSVTPYSIPSLQRALHALTVIVGRHIGGWKVPGDVNFNQPEISAAFDELIERCRAIDSEHLKVFVEQLSSLQNHWINESFDEWGSFSSPDPDKLPLMHPAGMPELDEWTDASWSTPSSMRSVDKESEAEVLSVYPD
ncbi:helicase-related protein [Microbulbifer sp. VAAC004]|uniref:helicase-related protein n=1 Tax=unclassified Microbulbifer TaxID=2619833 RepID=UPI00403AB89A